MAKFAIFYDDTDLTRMAVQIARSDLPSNLVALATNLWDGGFKDFQISSGAPYAYLEGDAFTRATVITCSEGIVGLSDLLYAIGAAFPNDPAAQYMIALGDDLNSGGIGANSSGIQPWTG